MSKYRNDIDPATFEQVENDLLGRMDAETKKQFETAMVADETLRNEVALQQKLLATIETETFLSAVPAVQTKPAPVRKLVAYWRYAAAAVLLLTAVALWLFKNPSKAPEQLFSQYFYPDPGLPVLMSPTSSYTFYDAMISYKEGNYEKAISQWELLEKDAGFTDTLHYYIGVAQLNNDQLTPAINRLYIVAKDEKSIFKDDAKWYLALCELKSDRVAAAENWLQQLPDNKNAQQLLADIKKLSAGK